MPPSSSFWRSLCIIGLISFLNIRWNSPLKPFGSGIFLGARFLITNFITLIDKIDFISFWSELFDSLCLSRNFSIYLSFEIYCHNISYNSLLISCNVCRIYGDVSFFIPDIVNTYMYSLIFLISLANFFQFYLSSQ